MAIETDADRAVFTDPRDFGLTITWTGSVGPVELAAIFDADYLLLSSDLVDGGVEGNQPQITIRSADLPPFAAQGDAVSFPDPDTTELRSFVVVELKPDGTGMTVVRLQES